MKRNPPYHRLLLMFLGLSLLACTWVTSLFGPRPVIILAPDPSANVTPGSLAVAQKVQTDRLIGMLGGEGVVVVDGNHLRVELANQSDVPDAIQLATEIGVLAFYDQVVPVPSGSPIPEEIVETDKPRNCDARHSASSGAVLYFSQRV